MYGALKLLLLVALDGGDIFATPNVRRRIGQRETLCCACRLLSYLVPTIDFEYCTSTIPESLLCRYTIVYNKNKVHAAWKCAVRRQGKGSKIAQKQSEYRMLNFYWYHDHIKVLAWMGGLHDYSFLNL